MKKSVIVFGTGDSKATCPESRVEAAIGIDTGHDVTLSAGVTFIIADREYYLAIGLDSHAYGYVSVKK